LCGSGRLSLRHPRIDGPGGERGYPDATRTERLRFALGQGTHAELREHVRFWTVGRQMKKGERASRRERLCKGLHRLGRHAAIARRRCNENRTRAACRALSTGSLNADGGIEVIGKYTDRGADCW